MLSFVPVVFEAYRSIRPHLRWTLQNLVAFADRTGRCFPSIRKIASITGSSKSAVARHLAALERDGALTRHRRPGGVFSYQIARQFLPSARLSKGLSHQRDQAVPAARTEENPFKKTERFARFGDDLAQTPWQQRVKGYRKTRFWLPQWGPTPDEKGCFATVV